MRSALLCSLFVASLLVVRFVYPDRAFCASPLTRPECLTLVKSYLPTPPPSSQVDRAFQRAMVNVPHLGAQRVDFFMPSSGEIVLSEHFNGEAWSVGTMNGQGMHEIFFRNPNSKELSKQFLVFMDVLRQGAFKKLRSNQMGIVLHIDSWDAPSQVYQIIDGALLSQPDIQRLLTKAQKSLPDDFRNFVITQYQKRLHIPEPDLDRLRIISKETQQRSVYFLKTKEGYFRTKKGSWLRLRETERPDLPEFTPAETKMPEHFTIEGGVTAVISNSTSELLPLEMFTGYRVPRPAEGKVLEVGRYAVSKDRVQPITPRLVEQVAAATIGQDNVVKVVIEADETHARLFSRYGFRSIHTRRNYNNDVEHIMEVDPHQLLQSVLERDFPEDSVNHLIGDVPAKFP